MAAATPPSPAASGRFTLDGAPSLEAHLASVCESVRTGIMRIVPASRLEGILLGGGYGRGEGGVLHTLGGDQPYNDLEFYVLLRGNTVINEWRHGGALRDLAHALSGPAGIEVEFKVISRADLRRNAVTMFSYDLVRAHRSVHGAADLLAGCEHHQRAEDIPLAEGTRLLMNRCTGLLFSQQRLARSSFTPADADFVERNLAKARLALGDAVLTAEGRYHWSCRERADRLAAAGGAAAPSWLEAVRREHAEGVKFKLQPWRSNRSASVLEEDFRRVSQLACRVWLWIESRRLGVEFRSPAAYAMHPAPKCPGFPVWRNWLVTARRIGLRELASVRARRYPRERLFRALPVLLWQPVMLVNPRILHRLQRELRTPAHDEAGLAAAYTRLWEHFR
jgi:hypothetical protein